MVLTRSKNSEYGKAVHDSAFDAPLDSVMSETFIAVFSSGASYTEMKS
jgi:hypothetical protein